MLENQKAKSKEDQHNSLYNYLAGIGIFVAVLLLIKFKNKGKSAADSLEVSKIIDNIQEKDLTQKSLNNPKVIEKAIETLTKSLENAINIINKNIVDMGKSITPESHKANLNKNFEEIDKLVNYLKNQIDLYLKSNGNDMKWTAIISDPNHCIPRAIYFIKNYTDIKFARN